MSQSATILAAHVVARSLMPNSPVAGTSGRPQSASKHKPDTRPDLGMDDGADSQHDDEASPFAGPWEDTEQQYPHFFAWLNSHNKRTARAAKKQPNQLSIASRPGSRESTSQLHTTGSSSRPVSAASSSSRSRPSSATSSCRPISATSTCRPTSATAKEQLTARVSALSTVPEHGTSKAGANATAPRPLSRASQSVQQLIKTDHLCSGGLAQQQNARFEGSFFKTSKSRPCSAGVVLDRSKLTARKHSATWLTEGQNLQQQSEQQQRQQQCPASVVPTWLQSLTAQHPASSPAISNHGDSGRSPCSDAGKVSAAQPSMSGEQSGQASNISSNNPWAPFGQDAPRAWQQLETAHPNHSQARQQLEGSFLQGSLSIPANSAERPGSPQSGALRPNSPHTFSLRADSWQPLDSRPHSPQSSAVAAGIAAACSSPDGKAQSHQQQLQQQTCPRAGKQMFLQLPLNGNASMTRQDLQLLAMGLQWALAEAGAPLSIQLPDYAAADHQQLLCWDAYEQVAAELHVWDKLLAELCRQSHAECSQRGTLLLSAVTRQQQILHEAMSACNTLHRSLQQASEESRQQQQRTQSLTQQLDRAQQQYTQLMANIAAKQEELDVVKADLEQHKERMRKGRYHLIAEQVQEAKIELQKRMLEQWNVQLQLTRADCAADEAATRSKWQEAVLHKVCQAVGQDVVDGLRSELAKLDNSMGQTSSVQQASKRTSKVGVLVDRDQDTTAVHM